LKSGRTHAATEPIPEGWIPGVHFYPGHPARNGSFDVAGHESFQRMIESFGLPDSLAIKRRVADAIKPGEPPSASTISGFAIAQDRHGRTSVRIALRQLKAAGVASPTLQAWVAKFDNAAAGDDREDEAALMRTNLRGECLPAQIALKQPLLRGETWYQRCTGARVTILSGEFEVLYGRRTENRRRDEGDPAEQKARAGR
jgi:hypothetical protein